MGLLFLSLFPPNNVVDSGPLLTITSDNLRKQPVDGPPQHIHALDGLRGLAALYVVLGHAYWLAVGDTSPWDHWFGVLRYQRFSVSIFIMLSGFCLAIPVINNGGILRGGYRKFLRRRAQRILPPYYAALIFSMILNAATYGGIFAPYSVKAGLQSLLTHILLIHNVVGNAEHSTFGDYRINGVTWSIAVEFQIYLFFPLFVRLWPKVSPTGTLTIVSVIAALLQLTLADTVWNGMNFAYYALFCAGMLAAKITQSPWHQSINRTALAAVALSALALLICFLHIHGTGWVRHHMTAFDVTCGIAAFPSLVAAVSIPAWRNLFSSSCPVLLGSFSYSLYLIHMPLLKLLLEDFVSPLMPAANPLAVFAPTLFVIIPMILIVAHKFYTLFELPYLRKRAAV